MPKESQPSLVSIFRENLDDVQAKLLEARGHLRNQEADTADNIIRDSVTLLGELLKMLPDEDTEPDSN